LEKIAMPALWNAGNNNYNLLENSGVDNTTGEGGR
jgi:hypothetical protein